MLKGILFKYEIQNDLYAPPGSLIRTRKFKNYMLLQTAVTWVKYVR